MDRRFAFDRDVLQAYTLAAGGDGSQPEGVAALRLSMYAGVACIVPSVKREIDEEGSQQERDWRAHGFVEITDTNDTYHGCVTTMTYRYMDYHSDPRDCRVVVEAECAKLDAFLTLNEELVKALADRAEQITIMTPSRYWKKVRVAHGSAPRWTPNETHPLHAQAWWRW
jgi:hypothetical protein